MWQGFINLFRSQASFAQQRPQSSTWHWFLLIYVEQAVLGVHVRRARCPSSLLCLQWQWHGRWWNTETNQHNWLSCEWAVRNENENKMNFPQNTLQQTSNQAAAEATTTTQNIFSRHTKANPGVGVSLSLNTEGEKQPLCLAQYGHRMYTFKSGKWLVMLSLF